MVLSIQPWYPAQALRMNKKIKQKVWTQSYNTRNMENLKSEHPNLNWQ